MDVDEDLLMGNTECNMLTVQKKWKAVQLKATEHTTCVLRPRQGWGRWQKAEDDGEGDEEAPEAFDLTACFQECGKDQVPHSNGKALPAPLASSSDGKCPYKSFKTWDKAEIKESCPTKAGKAEKNKTAAVTP